MMTVQRRSALFFGLAAALAASKGRAAEIPAPSKPGPQAAPGCVRGNNDLCRFSLTSMVLPTNNCPIYDRAGNVEQPEQCHPATQSWACLTCGLTWTESLT